jgi:predicted ATPase/DNA-binding SARP family transcriptional activator/predicted negative regulator of RcsB-dependent stress response
MARFSIALLGPFHTTLDGQALTDFATDKARALLAFLVVEADRSHRRDVLAGLLWPDQPQTNARQSLRQTLSYLRQALGGRGKATSFLCVSRDAVQFNLASDYELDVTAFTTLLETCRGHAHRHLGTCRPCLARLRAAVALYRGGFLEGFSLADSDLFEEWAVLKREWLQRQAVEALAHLADCAERRGDYAQARQYAWRQVELEPWLEEAHRQLMRLLALDGQRSAALAQYERCRSILDRELGVEPTAETTTLYQRISESALADLETRRPTNLPPSPTPFVGREREMVELEELLADPGCRLLTLVGPGGIGKTRLALQAAAGQIGAFEHGVFYAPLTALDSAEHIVPLVADALGFSFYGNEPPREQLLNYLREKELLLVLDNMEHLLDGGEWLARVLRWAPGVVLLVTSRERLNLHEECVFEVEGLSYPPDESAPEPQGYSAVELFMQSARRVSRRFALTEAETPPVLRICRLVEGMPLGVELAAAWVAVQSCADIAQELERNLDILSTALRNVPERHRSLRAALDHSWNLLTERERAVFRHLSVFRGGFDKAAAEQVAGAALAALAALVDKSLLRRNAAGRYEMHELLRQFAAEKLVENPQRHQEVRDRHCTYYAGLLQQRENWLQGGKQLEALEAINIELENVRMAWDWATAYGKTHEIAAALQGLGRFFEIRSRYREGAEVFARAAESLRTYSESAAPDREVVLAQVLAWQGSFSFNLGRYDEAQQRLQKSLEILERHAARPEMAYPYFVMGQVVFRAGDLSQAERYFRQSLEICQAVGDRYGAAQALDHCGDVAVRTGKFTEARAFYEQGLSIRRDIEDVWGVSVSLGSLGGLAGRQGNYQEAQARFEESLETCRRIKHQRGIAACLHNLSTLAYLRGEYGQAKRLRLETLAICQEIGYRWGVAGAYKSLGDAARHMGELEQARRYLEQSLEIFAEMGDHSSHAFALSSLAGVVAALGDTRAAWSYLQQALATAVEVHMLPLAMDVLGDMAGLLAKGKQAEREQALELATFVLAHPASEQQTQDRLAPLQAELISRLPAQERGQTRTLEEWVGEMLRGDG